MSSPNCTGLSVPGSLLLAGEYAVLQAGGLGYACAVEPRVHCQWQAQSQGEIICRFEQEEHQWSTEHWADVPVVSHVWHTLQQQHPHARPFPKVRLTLDSTALSHGDGRKAGLGSSAAATVAATAALLHLSTEQRPDAQTLFPLALAAHRRLQGGRGSGYDVACSVFGGVGLFRGGTVPSWGALEPAHAISFNLVFAPHAISTGIAIKQWQQWCQESPQVWSEHFAKTQAIVKDLATATDTRHFVSAMSIAATLGRRLGQEIGVWLTANEPKVPVRPRGGFNKALGAGNELYAVSCPYNHPMRTTISKDGLRWQ